MCIDTCGESVACGTAASNQLPMGELAGMAWFSWRPVINAYRHIYLSKNLCDWLLLHGHLLMHGPYEISKTSQQQQATSTICVWLQSSFTCVHCKALLVAVLLMQIL